MPCVETKIVINGDSKPIFEIIKNMEAYPSFMHDLVSVEILERGENTTVSHWVSNVDGRKIGSLGFKIRRGRSYHGLSLNIDCDLTGFQSINPCGYVGLEMVRVQDLVAHYPSFEQLCNDIIHYLQQAHLFNELVVKTE